MGADRRLATATTVDDKAVLSELTNLLKGRLKIECVPPRVNVTADIHGVDLPELPWAGALVGLYLGWRLIVRICLFNNWRLFLILTVNRILLSQSVIIREAELFCTRQHAVERVDAGELDVVG